MKKKKKLFWCIVLLLYTLLIIKLIIFKYPYSLLYETAQNWGIHFVKMGINSANFTPFKTIQMYLHYYGRLNSFENLFGNILIFIPFGFLAPLASDRLKKWFKLLLSSFIFILGIETFQLVTRFGEFDVDDIILNMTGVLIGWLCFLLARGWRRRSKKEKKIDRA